MRAFLMCLTFAAACLMTGCQAAMKTDPGAVVQGTVIAEDGVAIVYDVRGRGKTSLVFIHGWCSNRAFWREQVDALADDYRVVAIDLPGHGASGRDRDPWQVMTFAADVQAVVEKLGLKRVILVGHSMGGPVALEAARLMPGKVIGVVGVDTLKNAEAPQPAELLERIAVAFEQDFEGSMRGFLPQFFLPDADPQLVQWVIDNSLTADPVMASAIMRDFKTVGHADLFSSAGVPIRCINAAPRSPGPGPTLIDTNRKYADYDAVLMEGVFHFPQLERPEEFNARLRAFIEALDGN